MSLREALQTITLNQDVSVHEAELANLTKQWPNRISVLGSEVALSLYTCVMYVFEFIKNPQYRYYAYQDVYAGNDFVNWLMSSRIMRESPPEKVERGDLIFYLDEYDFRHVGILLDSDLVVSKWGIGNLYRHAIWEVPISYGNRLRCFEKLGPTAALSAFQTYAESKGVQRIESAS